MADADVEGARLPSALAPLPHAIVLLIFALLPVDLRARCACVCRGWRAALSERALWTRLDVSRTSGVTVAVTNALLRGAVARAGGELTALDVSGSRAVSLGALRAVVTANAATLRTLRVCHGVLGLAAEPLPLADAWLLRYDVPRLCVLEVDVECAAAALRSVLDNEGLRVHGLSLSAAALTEAQLLTLAADVASHAWLRELCLVRVLPTPAALDAFVDAALARRLTALEFSHCGLSPAAAPALARLLGAGSALESLCVCEGRQRATLLDAPSAALLAAALRANSTLTLPLGAEGAAAAGVLLDALTAHPSLRTLSLSETAVRTAGDRVAVGFALGVLLAANAPALTALRVDGCLLEDAGLTPLFEALRHSTHLRTLNCFDNRVTPQFALAVLLPAVRANASLRALT
jgi:hypothetical protein